VKILFGAAAAAVAALIASGASVAGIAVWKIALALAGLAMFVMGGSARGRSA
jgi:hypothetical protein